MGLCIFPELGKSFRKLHLRFLFLFMCVSIIIGRSTFVINVNLSLCKNGSRKRFFLSPLFEKDEFE